MITSLTAVRLWQLTLCVLPLYLSACTPPRGEANGTPFELDQISAARAQITTRVKAALVADDRIAAASIQVVFEMDSGQRASRTNDGDDSSETSQEALRLEGFVNDEAERDAALETARGASQGRKVIDALKVR